MTPVRVYHAHIYFDADDRSIAIRLRDELDRRFPVQVGRVHDRPVGPHAKAMFQVIFTPGEFGRIVPWLMEHRAGLDILVHPDTGDELSDHRDRAMWLGHSLPIDLDKLVHAA